MGDATEQRQQMRALLDSDLPVLDICFLAHCISNAGRELPQSLVHRRYRLKRRFVVTSNRGRAQDWVSSSPTPWRQSASWTV